MLVGWFVFSSYLCLSHRHAPVLSHRHAPVPNHCADFRPRKEVTADVMKYLKRVTADTYIPYVEYSSM